MHKQLLLLTILSTSYIHASSKPPISPRMGREGSEPDRKEKEADTSCSCCPCMVPDKSMPSLDQLNAVSFIPLQNVDPKFSVTRESALKFLKELLIEGTMVINGTLYRIERGVSDKLKLAQKPVTIYSGGYSHRCRPYSYGGYTAIRAGLVPGSCVTFDFPTDTQRGFNFCQEQDLHCLQTICDAVVARYPKAPLILHGACKSATNNLRFLAEHAERESKENAMQNIRAVIAESPPISVPKVLQHTPLSTVTLFLASWVLPNYNPNSKTIMQARALPPVPVLIASLPEDTISKLDDVKRLRDHLTTCKGNITLFVSEYAKLQHGKIREAEDYQKEVASFLQKLGLQPDTHQKSE